MCIRDSNNFSCDIDIEKLSFIVSIDPNVILLLGTTLSTVNNISSIVNLCSQQLKDLEKKMAVLKINPDDLAGGVISHQIGITLDEIPNVVMILSSNRAFAEQVDDAIYMVEKSFDVLNIYARKRFKDKHNIKSISFSSSDYDGLKPDPIESWEKAKFFPEKKHNILNWFNTLLNKPF